MVNVNVISNENYTNKYRMKVWKDTTQQLYTMICDTWAIPSYTWPDADLRDLLNKLT